MVGGVPDTDQHVTLESDESIAHAYVPLASMPDTPCVNAGVFIGINSFKILMHKT